MKTYRQDSGGHLYAEARNPHSEKLGICYWVKHRDVRRLDTINRVLLAVLGLVLILWLSGCTDLTAPTEAEPFCPEHGQIIDIPHLEYTLRGTWRVYECWCGFEDWQLVSP